MSDSEDSSSSSFSSSSENESSSSENEIKQSKSVVGGQQKKKVLFQDDSSDEGETVEFKVNENFAKQYRDKKEKNLTTSASTNAEEDEDSEDDDAKFDSKKMNDGFLTLLPLIAKKRYDILKNEKVKFFNKGTESDSDDDDDEDDEFNSSNSKTTKKTPFTIKDYQRNKITKTMDNEQYQESDEEEGNGKDEDFDSLPHNRQQEQLKKAFIDASNRQLNDDGIGEENSDSDDDGLLVKRKKTAQDQLDEEREFELFKARLEKKKSPLLAQESETIAEFWKGKDATPDEKFLRDYLLGQKWQSDKGKLPTYEEILKELDQDEGETTKQDDFERSFNFRYEEPGAAIIVSHSRTIDNSIRRKESARKTKREKKKERKENRAVQNQEKIKQLKNEKKKEILEKVKEINSITGSSLFNLSSVDIKKIDPEIMVKSIGKKLKQQPSYDEQQQQQYGGEEEDGGEEYYDGYGDEDDGQQSGGMDLNKLIESGYYDDQFEDDGEVWSNDRMSKEREELESMLDKYYEMDYQDLLGDDTPVRFKYTKVDPDTTITIDDILEKEDKDLEKILPLSKIATYYNPSYKGYSEKAEKRYFDQNKNSKYITKSKNTNYNSKYNKIQKSTDNNNNNKQQQQVPTKQFNKKEEQPQQPKQSYNNKPTTTTTTTTTSAKPVGTPAVAPGEKKRKSKNKNKLNAKVQKVE